MRANKIPVYFMPGMAANPSIFQHIKLPETHYETYYLEWFIPEKKETISQYAFRMTKKIHHENIVLIGVSFGGILVQEMAKHIKVRKLIVISSVKTKHELPRRMRFARATRIYKLFPTGLVNNVEVLTKYAFGDFAKKRAELYKEFLSVRDKRYIDWAIAQIVNWKQKEALPNTIHIHGDNDLVFPIHHIKECIHVKKGTHIMILNKFKWFNENLPKLITE